MKNSSSSNYLVNEKTFEISQQIISTNNQFYLLDENLYAAKYGAYNAAFDTRRGDGTSKCYFPLLSQNPGNSVTSLLIKYISWMPNVELTSSRGKFSEELMNVSLIDSCIQTTETPCGCKLSDTGILWIPYFKSNTLLGIDLINRIILFQISIPSPVDVSFSTFNENILYIAGSKEVLDNKTAFKNPQNFTHHIPNTSEIYRLDCSSENPAVELYCPHLPPIASLHCTSTHIYFTDLYSICRIPFTELENWHSNAADSNNTNNNNINLTPSHVKSKIETIWSAYRQSNESNNNNNNKYKRKQYPYHSSGASRRTSRDLEPEKVYLVDKISFWDTNHILIPLYREWNPPVTSADSNSRFMPTNNTPNTAVNNRNKNSISHGLNMITSIMSRIKVVHSLQRRLSSSIYCDEMTPLLTESNMEECRFMIINLSTLNVRQYIFPMMDNIIPTDVCFSGQVTDILRHNSKCIFISNRSKFVLTINDADVSNALFQAMKKRNEKVVLSDFGKLVQL